MPLPVSGVVMAGGKSRRFGQDKAQVRLMGQPLLFRVAELLATVCQELIVVGPPERKLLLPEARVIQDSFPDAGPLSGLHAALNRARHHWAIVVACDMPLLNPALLRYLLSLREGYDVVLPRHGGYTQQLHAAYSTNCLPHIEAQLAKGDYKIDRSFPLCGCGTSMSQNCGCMTNCSVPFSTSILLRLWQRWRLRWQRVVDEEASTIPPRLRAFASFLGHPGTRAKTHRWQRPDGMAR